MYKIAKFLKINGALYGVQSEAERHLTLPGEGSPVRYGIWRRFRESGMAQPPPATGKGVDLLPAYENR